MIETLQYYFSYDFVIYALVVGTLIALCASLLGVSLVTKRYSYIGGGLANVAFGAMSVATIFDLANETLLVLPVTIITSILILSRNYKKAIFSDSLIAMISVSAMAIGYLVMNLFPTSSNIAADVCTTLFGSTTILTLSKQDVVISILLSLFVIIWFIIYYNKIFATTFDEEFMSVSGLNTSFYNFMIAVVISVIVVLGMNLVGSLLITALIIFPTLSSMKLFNNFKSVVILSSIIATFSASFGIIASILFATPVGSTIVLANLIVFIATYLLNIINGRFNA